MCFSFNDKPPTATPSWPTKKATCASTADEEQADAMRAGQVLQMIAAGGNAYYLAKLAGIFGLDMQDIGAQQTGMTKDEFKAKLVAANDQKRQSPSVANTLGENHGTTHRRPRHLAHPRHRRRHPQGQAAGPVLEALLRRLSAGRHWLAEVKPDVVVFFTTTTG
jgi:protocatechuate 4,5-dioxygenase alpha chain